MSARMSKTALSCLATAWMLIFQLLGEKWGPRENPWWFSKSPKKEIKRSHSTHLPFLFLQTGRNSNKLSRLPFSHQSSQTVLPPPKKKTGHLPPSSSSKFPFASEDSKCSEPDAIAASLVAMTTSPPKHAVLSGSCSAACEAVNDAIRQFHVLQVGARHKDDKGKP